HAWAIRETLDLLLRVFPARTCSAGVFRRAGQIGRPCLLGYIGKCSAPCVGRVSAAEHRGIVDDFCEFMSGQTARYIRRLDKEMTAAATAQDYERAARLRDDLAALRRAMEKQAVVFSDGVDTDVAAFAEDPLEAAVQVFYVRGGRVRGQRGWVVEKVADIDTAGLVEQFLTQAYLDEGGEIPREVLVPALPPDLDSVTRLLEDARGAKVSIRVPQRGDKRSLLDTVARNAADSLARHKLHRASDLSARSRALAELQDCLGLPAAPLRIECFDVSHLAGTDVVASMVVFEDGVAKKSDYRRFAVRAGGDDLSAMREVITRRFRRELAAGPPEPELRTRRFAYPPNLLVVDGGAGQVAAASSVLKELSLDDVAVVGLAKRLEEVWLPADPDPVVLPRGSEALYLLQRVRDEAHRFAITYHRAKRSRAMRTSALDAVPGLGVERRKALLRHVGSLRQLRQASLEEIVAVPGVGPATARAVLETLAASPAAPDADLATGEIREGAADFELPAGR
ncbi:MAG: excinuclease ABC subunit UvrC, partial [Mycobacteriales bacterium]